MINSRFGGLSLALALALAPAVHAQVNIAVDATTAVRVVDDRQFGMNTPFWDSTFTDSQSADAFTQMNTRIMRFGGGSATDQYNWETGKDLVGNYSWAFNVDAFAAQAKKVGAMGLITTNYGSDTPQHAAAYVQYCNVQKGYGFKYWEVGNECYGTWEYDTTANPHDPYTYATRAVQYIQAMKAVDPSIKIGVVATPGEDSNSNNYTSHPATNPRTNTTHNGWVPVMLATMKAAGVLPDFIIDHRYEQNAGSENDATLLQDSDGTFGWAFDATNLRQMLTDYLGSSGSSIEILVTENNSVSTNPGKQSTSLVNALYLADSTGNLMQTEINGLIWWDFHNGQSSSYNNSTSLYGWRNYGDYGVESGSHDKYPTFYVSKLLAQFARGGDTVVKATSSSTLLSAYAVKRRDGTLSLLVINKSPTATQSATIALTGFTPKANGTAYSYGIPQDLNSEQNAAAPATGFSWENSLEGWVNQSGQPDDATTNYGLNAPFLYSTAYSTTNGVTKGTYSLACTTTNATPGNSAVIQNSTAAIGTAMSTAASVSVDIYPQTSTSGTLQASLYLNGKNLAYVALGPVTLNANQENTATFTLTDAQRAGVLASLGTGNWFQVGININSPGPITCYFDNFVITPTASAAAATPISGAAPSPDIAVSSLSNIAASFTASFAPYSATVLSLTGPTSAPVATSQPTSQNVAIGSTATFTFGVSGSPTPTFQWYLNGNAIAGATGSTVVVTGATAAQAGSYTCTATNPVGSVTSGAATLSVASTNDPGRLINLSCRAGVGTGANILIAGFAVGPNGASGKQALLVRASGPALTAFSVSGVLPDPKLDLYTGAGALISTNSGWGGLASIASTSAAVNAFAWSTSPLGKDAALLASEQAGPYTAQVSGASNDTGVSLAEVYDATPTGSYTSASPRLVNLSARVAVGTGGNILIAGFVVGGTTSKAVLVRASGPALTAFSVTGVLPDPKLQLYTGAGALIASNSGWGGDPQIASTATSVGAFSWGTSATPDSALLVTLPPGAYTAQVSGASGDTGVSLVEVYDVP